MAVGDRIDDTAFDSVHEVTSTEGTVLDMAIGFNASTDTHYYFQLFDKSSTPVNDDVPKRSFSVPALANFSYVAAQFGDRYLNGLWWALSSAPDTYQDAGVDDDAWVSIIAREVTL